MEYQYYEFCRIHSPMTAEAHKVMRSLSSRAKVGSHTAAYVYNYGEFGYLPKPLLLDFFDVFFYLSNFGSAQLILKYSCDRIDMNVLKQFSNGDMIEVEQHDNDVLITLNIHNEESEGLIDGEGKLVEILPLYDELLNNNYHLLQVMSDLNKRWTDDDFRDFQLNAASLTPAEQAFLGSIGLLEVINN